MNDKSRKVSIFIFFLFFTFFSSLDFSLAQRRNYNYSGRRQIGYSNPEYIEEKTGGVEEGSDEETHIADPLILEKVRTYDLTLDFGLGNLSYEERSSSGVSGGQSLYSGDMYIIKTSVMIGEIKDKWEIDIGGGILVTREKLERWWTNNKLFRINGLLFKGLSMETLIRYNGEDMGLYPFSVIAQSNLGVGFVYRFFGLRRDKGIDLLQTQIKTPRLVDFALFGIEPLLGLNFTMEDGTFNGYINIGTGFYGTSVESTYDGKTPTAPSKTYARSILAKVGLKGEKGRFFYNVGYSMVKYKITAKKNIPDSRIDQDRIVFDFGATF